MLTESGLETRSGLSVEVGAAAGVGLGIATTQMKLPINDLAVDEQVSVPVTDAMCRSIVDNSPDIIMRFDRAGRHLYVSASVVGFVGTEPAAFIGKTHRELGFSSQMCNFFEAAIFGVFERGEPFETEFEMDLGRGRFVFNWRLIPERGVDGTVESVLSIARDVTAVQDVQHELTQSEQRYRALVASATDHIFMLDLRGRIVMTNREGWVTPAGRGLVGLTIEEACLAEDIEEYRSKFQEVLESGLAVEFEHEYGTGAGARLHLDKLYPLLQGGRAWAVGGICRDITEQRRWEDAIKDSEAKYKALVENQLDLVARFDLLGRYTYLNPAALNLLCVLGSDWAGKRPCEVGIPAEGHEAVELAVKEVLEVGEVRTLSLWCRTGDELMAVDWRFFPERSGVGVVTGVMGVGRDVTGERRMQERLARSDKLVSLGTLVAGVAHEIKNPTSFISLNLPLLRDMFTSLMPLLDGFHEAHGEFKIGGLAYSEARDFVPVLLDGIEQGASRIDLIVSELRDFARADSRESFREVDVNKVVQAAIVLMISDIRRVTSSFEQVLDPQLPLVNGCFYRLEQVVINLLQNACMALTSKDQKIGVSTYVEESGGAVVLVVSDCGRGISEQMLPRVRDPFFTTRRDAGGTGLGLSISDRIVCDHGGELEIFSEERKGTRVFVRIPVIDRKG